MEQSNVYGRIHFLRELGQADKTTRQLLLRYITRDQMEALREVSGYIVNGHIRILSRDVIHFRERSLVLRQIIELRLSLRRKRISPHFIIEISAHLLSKCKTVFTLFQFKTPTRKRLLFSESLSPVFGPENGQNVADLNEQEGIFKTPTRKRLFFSESLSPVFESRQKVARLNDQEIISIEWETEETKEDTIDDSPVSLFEEVKLRVRLYHLVD